MCMNTCIYVCIPNVFLCAMPSTHGGKKRALDPLKPELKKLWAAVWVLRVEPSSSGRAASVLDHLTLPVQPDVWLFMYFLLACEPYKDSVLSFNQAHCRIAKYMKYLADYKDLVIFVGREEVRNGGTHRKSPLYPTFPCPLFTRL